MSLHRWLASASLGQSELYCSHKSLAATYFVSSIASGGNARLQVTIRHITKDLVPLIHVRRARLTQHYSKLQNTLSSYLCSSSCLYRRL